mmetsp:Transcript_6242/g.13740  ORF Transcript_6242/g.13740 Transcript_6242/m.13740 type:complete len:127 (-) Transcript_6242:120-500(-)
MADWHNGLFEICGEPGGFAVCCMTTLCPCMALAEIGEHLSSGNGESTLVTTAVMYACCCSPCVLCVYDCPYREEVAKKADINDHNPWLKVACCLQCHECQVVNEVRWMQQRPKEQQARPTQHQMGM